MALLTKRQDKHLYRETEMRHEAPVLYRLIEDHAAAVKKTQRVLTA
ncbi:hypothetical protein AB1286_18965 [Trinickia sp. NRRL B-1857]